MRVEKCEIQGNKNSEEIKLLEKKCTTELSRVYIKEEEKIPYVFTAPPRNRYFAGRTKEIQELKRILKVEGTSNVRVAAVCGLCGIGKTSLVSEYAHQMKDFYKGGVYWFSAEDDKILEKTMNDIALKLKAILGSFDLTLSNTMRNVGTTNDPSLIVLDCLDELDLSSNMRRFLSFPSQENFFGHFVVLTRRNPIRLFNEVSVFEDDSCLQLECFQPADAKQFLFSRSKVVRDENVENDAECLCDELGRLPLALEQAGAYIQIRRCNFSTYLKQYKTERLRLLKRQRARAAGNDSSERLAVHTTWLINTEFIKKSPDGQAAVRFMNACSFLNGNEIEEELINVGTPEVEDVEYRKCVLSPLGCREVLNLLSDFSLFTYVGGHSVCTHRLVQELVWESLTPESKAESFIDAVRMLSYAFSKCFSPSNLVNSDENNGEEQNIAICDLPKSPSHFYMWSKFCMHGHHLCRNMENLLVTLGSVCQDSVWFPETAKILYECAVHLSANHKQEKAKRILNFAYRILDWFPLLAGYETVAENVSNNSLFPLFTPLPKCIQIVIKRCCMPPFVSLQRLTEKPGGLDLDKLKESIEKLKLDGNKRFKDGRYKEALDAYSSAIDLAQECNNAFNPLLLTNRASVYIKLKQYEDALKDANNYITRRPDCWKGYARKAPALDGLNEKVSAEIAAALAFYHNRAVFSGFPPFKESFFDLQKRIFVCDTVDQLQKAIFSHEVETGVLKILVLGSEEYILNSNTLVEPWNHCILVGTKKICSVSLKSDNVISLSKCMLTNLSFHLINSQLVCLLGSFVKILNCDFTSYHGDDIMPVVATMGDLSAEQCNFTGSNDAGLECVEPRSKTSKCVVMNCDIDHNGYSGIGMVHSKNVTLIRNSLFGNEIGIFMFNSEASIRENNIFDNDLWGIWSQSNSWCSMWMNKVFRNKAGGVRVGFRAAGKEFPPSVFELNKICDNIGPGFVENVNSFEVHPWALGKNENLMKSYFESPNSLKSARFQDNEEHNNKENENVGKLNLSVPYCSNCRLECTSKICKKCFTTAYCGKKCKRNHRSKHDTICKVLREKSSYLITSMKRVEYDITQEVEGSKEIGPNDSVRRPRKGRRFDVKVHTSSINRGRIIQSRAVRPQSSTSREI
ncbi:Hsp70-Hsp90 organizing 1 [Paramuricea clavata]|nr:Hsp70-Hsp90 organizing 1 [Paramuricea clavata]